MNRRVLHCIPTMGGGGAERQLAYLASGLRDQGWSVHVAFTRRGPNWTRLESSGATLHDLGTESAYDWRALPRLRRLITTVAPDLVHVWLLQMEVVGGLAALSTGSPWVFGERSSAHAYPPSAKHLLRRWVARFASAIVSNSAGGDAYWREHLGSRPRRVVIPNGLPLEEIDAVPPATAIAMRLPLDQPVVLFAGRFDAAKNLPTLFAALDRVLETRHVRVRFSGDGDRRGDVEQWAARWAASGRVAVTGYVDDLWGVMKSAAVVVSPSRFEGSPNVVLEAMACEVPLVVSDIPQHRELLDDASATFVPVLDAVALAAAIERALDDRPAAVARAAQARASVVGYSVDRVARRYSDLYEQVISGVGRRAQ
jgi:glycosyltransferase involved in cell wall biosynthesis